VTYDGLKFRMLFVSPDAAARAFFYGINFEFSFNSVRWDPSRYTQEMRPILAGQRKRADRCRNLGRVRHLLSQVGVGTAQPVLPGRIEYIDIERVLER
jgi:hypothetical protein